MINPLSEHKQEAYERAIDSLARYKFMNFGYWAAIWIHLNQIDTNKESNPFRILVQKAREIQRACQQPINGPIGNDTRP